jgi:hypothetical protein
MGVKPLTLMVEHILMLFENTFLRKKFGPRHKVTGSLRKLHNEELYNVYFHKV